MTKINKNILLLTSVVILVATGLIIGLVFSYNTQKVSASVPYGNEYHSTTTVKVDGSVNLTNYKVINTGNGTLGSIIITGVGTGYFNIYDATSTVTNTSWATTTLAIIPASASAGTYVFDTIYQKGLLIEYSGALATSTITYR